MSDDTKARLYAVMQELLGTYGVDAVAEAFCHLDPTPDLDGLPAELMDILDLDIQDTEEPKTLQ